MVSKNNHLIKLVLCIVIHGLAACDSNDSRRLAAIEEGRQFIKSGQSQKAQVAFNTALAIDPQDVESRYEIAEALSQGGDRKNAAMHYQIIANQDTKHLMARVKAGQIYLAAANMESAEKMAQEAIAIDPNNTDALVLMGQIHVAKNNSDAAFVSAEAALTKNPDAVSATLLLASLYARTGKVEKAITLLQQNSEKNPRNTAPLLMLASLYQQTQPLEKTQEVLVSMIKIEPNQLDHRKRLALFLIANHQIDKAETVLREAFNALPDNPFAKLLLVDFLVQQKSIEGAIAELIPMIEENTALYDLRFKLADLQMALKQSDKVEETLKEVIELDKTGDASRQARNKLARLYRASHRVNDAKVLVKQLLVDNPNDFDALILRGEFALAENRAQDAIDDFRLILANQPTNINTLNLLSSAHLLNNDYVLAQENLQKVLAIDASNESARVALVNLLLQLGDKEQATQQLNTLFKLNPTSKNGLEALCKIYLAQKQGAQAQQIASRLETLFPDEASGYFLAGLAYQLEGKFDKSASKFELARLKQPDAVEPLSQLIASYLALKQADKAISKLQEINKNQPKNFFAYDLLGDVYRHGNHLKEAAIAYQKAINIQPDWSVAYRRLALIYGLQKQEAEAIDVLQAGLNKAVETQGLVADLAMIYHENGEHQQVIALYEALYEKNPTSLTALNNLARYLLEYGADKGALERAEKLAEPLAKMNNADLLDTVGWIAYKQGNYLKAQQVLSKAIALNADSAVSHYHLGMTYFKQDSKSRQAKAHLQEAIDKKENFKGLIEAKATLKAMD